MTKLTQNRVTRPRITAITIPMTNCVSTVLVFLFCVGLMSVGFSMKGVYVVLTSRGPIALIN